MDFFKSGLKTVLGTPESGNLPSPAETVSFRFIIIVFIIKEHFTIIYRNTSVVKIQFAVSQCLMAVVM